LVADKGSCAKQRVDARLDRGHDQLGEALGLSTVDPPGDQRFEARRRSVVPDAASDGPAHRGVARSTDDGELILAKGPGRDQLGEQRCLGLGVDDARPQLVEAICREVAAGAQAPANLSLELRIAEPREGSDRSLAQVDGLRHWIDVTLAVFAVS
jgi:hypothetical protein